MAAFVRKIGYAGLVVFIDECVNLYGDGYITDILCDIKDETDVFVSLAKKDVNRYREIVEKLGLRK